MNNNTNNKKAREQKKFYFEAFNDLPNPYESYLESTAPTQDEEDALINDLEEQDSFFIPSNDDLWFIPVNEECHDIIAKVENRYYIWLEDGEQIMELIPMLIDIEEEQEEQENP